MEKFAVGERIINNTIIKLLNDYPYLNIRYSPYRKKLNEYFFINNLGIVYSIHQSDINKYISIGSIFDDDIIKTWYNYNNYR